MKNYITSTIILTTILSSCVTPSQKDPIYESRFARITPSNHNSTKLSGTWFDQWVWNGHNYTFKLKLKAVKSNSLIGELVSTIKWDNGSSGYTRSNIVIKKAEGGHWLATIRPVTSSGVRAAKEPYSHPLKYDGRYLYMDGRTFCRISDIESVNEKKLMSGASISNRKANENARQEMFDSLDRALESWQR